MQDDDACSNKSIIAPESSFAQVYHFTALPLRELGK